MFRIRKVHDSLSSANRAVVARVLEILRTQFPNARKEDFAKIPRQLHDPVSHRYRSALFVAEDGRANVKGFAMLLHFSDLGFGYLELIAAAPKQTSGGIGAVLYERVREEARELGLSGLFFECAVDDGSVVSDPALLAQNRARMKFYERFGVRPVMNNVYASPVRPGDKDLYYLMYDHLGSGRPLSLELARKAVKAILKRKYGDLIPADQIREVVRSFTDDPVIVRPPLYFRREFSRPPALHAEERIALVVSEGHEIHHVKSRGYVESPVRLPSILTEIDRSGLFERMPAGHCPDKVLNRVHDAAFTEYFKKACQSIAPGQSYYPIIFPVRNINRPPRDIELQVGYYCIDTFTPFSADAWKAARQAVDCAYTGARQILDGRAMAYALVRPPGHHAERRAFGGFCYFNSAAVAAEVLSDYGRVAVLDVDFHHGNGTQNIFYERPDVLTLSIHGDPTFAYPHFAGFRDERGKGAGEGFNVNYPLLRETSPEQYRETLAKALRDIARFKPAYLVVSLGLDTAKADPTGTWALVEKDFSENGRMIGALGLDLLVVQEGGYRTRTLGVNARAFFAGLVEGAKAAAGGALPDRKKLNADG